MRESWKFSFKLRELFVGLPTDRDACERAVYCKWRRGRERGKLTPVALDAKTAKITTDGRLHVQIVEEFEFICHFERDPIDPELLQPKTLDLEIILLFMENRQETRRRCLYTSSFDLRRLLEGAREREIRAHTFMLCPGKQHFLRVSYAVSSPDAPPPRFSAPPRDNGTAARDVPETAADEEMVSMSLRGDGNFRASLPVLRCSESNEIPAVSQAMEAARLTNTHLRGDALTTLGRMLQEGESRRCHIADMPLDVAFDVLFNDSAPFVTFMHEARRNRHFCDQPWRVEEQHAWKRVQYQGRFGEDYKKCIETALLITAEDDTGAMAFYKLAVIDVPDLPVNARLQLLVSCRPEGAGGVTVLFCGYAHIANAMARMSFGAKATKHLTKVLAASEEALQTLAKAPNPTQTTATPAADDAVGMVVDANLWARLGDDVAVNAAVAEYYLRTLLISPNPRGADKAAAWRARLRSLDQVLHRFNRDEGVVALTLQHLQRAVSAIGIEVFATTNSDIVAAAEDSTHQFPGLRAKWGPFVASLHRAAAEALRRRREALVNSANPLAALGDVDVLADAELVAVCLESALKKFSPMRKFTFDEVTLLTKAMGLHIGVAAVTHYAMRIVDMLSDKEPFKAHSGFVALLDALLRIRPEIGIRFRHTLDAVNESGGATEFQMRFGTFIQQTPSFEASIWDVDHGVGATLYVTESFVCVGGDVIERQNISKVDLFRTNLVKPAVALAVKDDAGAERTLRFSTWSRSGLIEALNTSRTQ